MRSGHCGPASGAVEPEVGFLQPRSTGFTPLSRRRGVDPRDLIWVVRALSRPRPAELRDRRRDGTLVERRHDVGAGDASERAKVLQQLDTNALAFRFRFSRLLQT